MSYSECVTLTKDDIRLTVCVGDLTEFTGDAIVNPANTKLLMGGGVAGVIKRKGGEEIEREALKHAPVPIGKAVTTGAGKLKCKYVIHSPTVEEPASPSSPEKVYLATKAALEEAKRVGVKSIAFPLMGAGVGGLTPEQSIESMSRAFLESGKGLEIYVVVLSRDILKTLIQRLKDLKWSQT